MANEALNAPTGVPMRAPSAEVTAEVTAPRGFAIRLSPAASSASWVDVLPLSGERTGVVVARCAEPAIAARLRTTMRESLQRSADPTDALDGLDGLPVSALCAVIEASTLAYCRHGDAATAVVVPGGPAAADDHGRLAVRDLAPGATVLLSTAPISGAAALLDAGPATHPEELADRVVPTPSGFPGVATVLYRHPPEPMTITLPATPQNLAVSRGRLRQWLAEAGVDRESCADVLLAVGEATANATEHSVTGTDHQVHLTVSAALNGSLLTLAVSDDGRWKPASVSQGHRGHGLPLINALVDSVELTATPEGTTVSMLKELP